LKDYLKIKISLCIKYYFDDNSNVREEKTLDNYRGKRIKSCSDKDLNALPKDTFLQCFGQ
jgi:hypothetical protein